MSFVLVFRKRFWQVEVKHDESRRVRPGPGVRRDMFD